MAEQTDTRRMQLLERLAGSREPQDLETLAEAAVYRPVVRTKLF